jgi:SNF2 family DNA or RNA helicase
MTERLVEQFYGQRAVAYTGQMNAKQKEAAKREFQEDPNVRVLVSSDAGGYGVDLPQANLLINYDLADTAGADAQRRARIKRASSTWPSVKIQDFLIKGSIEERMREALRQKAGVQAAVVDGEGISKDGGLLLSLGSLSRFLRDTPGVV